VGIIGFSGGNVFYDSLLISVAPSGKEDMVSALGFGLGYLGGGLLFAFNVLMTLKPAWFGYLLLAYNALGKGATDPSQNKRLEDDRQWFAAA
jgi:MFS-type transporter involved in bile tolerance (Atg22 family)